MTESITFTIYGNQEDENGNPLGYHRTTQNSSWNPASRRYERWKEYVRQTFFDAGYKADDVDDLKSKLNVKPISTSEKRTARMDIQMEFANNTRPDCSNVYKGIEDALFRNDKYVMWGNFSGITSKEKKGKVKVTIHFIK